MEPIYLQYTILKHISKVTEGSLSCKNEESYPISMSPTVVLLTLSTKLNSHGSSVLGIVEVEA